MPVSTGKSNCRLSMRTDGSHKCFVNPSCKHHKGRVAGFRVGDPKTGDELTLLAELS
jgi:hypothetical protein